MIVKNICKDVLDFKALQKSKFYINPQLLQTNLHLIKEHKHLPSKVFRMTPYS